MAYDDKTQTITTGPDSTQADVIIDLGLHFIGDIRYYAAMPQSPAIMAADWKIMESWLGCRDREFNQSDRAKLAQAFPSYMARRVPYSADPHLNSAFAYFTEQFERFGCAGVPAPPEVEEVFDRMFGIETELATKVPIAGRSLKPAVAMGEVTHYANNKYMCCCSIKLLNGERVMISIASAPTPSVKVFKMGLFGIFRSRTIWEYNPSMAGGYEAYVRKMMMMFQEPSGTEPTHPLDILRDRLLRCKSVAAVRDSLFDAERSLSR